jgi:hypothetical protein
MIIVLQITAWYLLRENYYAANKDIPVTVELEDS